jgi:TRAP-type C4-dicarboxylate transport system permease small subunit
VAENTSIFLSGLEKWLKVLARWFSIVSALSLLIMMVITAIDVFGRWLFAKPLYGAYELVGTLLIIAGPFAMAITQIDKRHISINLVVDLLPLGLQRVLHSISLLLDFFIYGTITVGLLVLSHIYWQRGAGAVSDELGFRLIYPAICFLLASILYTIVILLHLTQSIHALAMKRR